ncbi:MAG: class C sortase, partial [Propionicimonas sp.]|nr:class C sortase [Propionicimonas sp.]
PPPPPPHDEGEFVTRAAAEAPGSRLEPAAPARRRWKLSWSGTGLALLLVAGVAVNQYPAVASWVAQYHQSQLISDVASAEVHQSAQHLETELDRARAYNEQLVGGALVAANDRLPTSDAGPVGGYDYNALLDATPDKVMGRLRIPAIDVDLPIYHGTDDVTLTKGVGHLEGTSLPVGGTSQHTVLTAHRGLPQATLFDDLDKVVVGDTFTIELFGEVLTYRVVTTQVVQPDQNQALNPVYGRDLATLVTCTPLGINSHRILVTGERVLPTPVQDLQAAGQPPDIPGFPWWTVVIAGALTAAALIVRRTGYPPARRPNRALRGDTGATS